MYMIKSNGKQRKKKKHSAGRGYLRYGPNAINVNTRLVYHKYHFDRKYKDRFGTNMKTKRSLHFRSANKQEKNATFWEIVLRNVHYNIIIK